MIKKKELYEFCGRPDSSNSEISWIYISEAIGSDEETDSTIQGHNNISIWKAFSQTRVQTDIEVGGLYRA